VKFLLTNDDGIDAPGIAALAECVARIASPRDQIMVVAPDRQRSECGHSVTLGRPLRIKQHKADWFSVDGTPVDCVRVAMTHLAQEVDVVLSGINQGANLGVDVMVSGTVAAAREASLHAPIAIALSHYRHPDIPKTWNHVPHWTEKILRRIIDRAAKNSPQAGLVWNVNLPAVDPSTLGHGEIPPIVQCPLDMNPHQRTPVVQDHDITFTSNFQARRRDIGSDVDLCFGGAITVTVLNSDASQSEQW
jgi:5'-nucleotidase